ncbi:hypothetical protein KAW48_05230 [candidate division WOR-3 bacterium]|nr:hypothetical protein [candidate division WOR-3 bacterium]
MRCFFVASPFFIVGFLIILFRKPLGNKWLEFNKEKFKRHPWLKNIQTVRYKNLDNKSYWWNSTIGAGILFIISGLLILVQCLF